MPPARPGDTREHNPQPGKVSLVAGGTLSVWVRRAARRVVMPLNCCFGTVTLSTVVSVRLLITDANLLQVVLFRW